MPAGDYFHLPDGGDRSQWFNASNSWQQWEKPRGISMIHMYTIGPGLGGGGGYSAGGATQAGGGGGGPAGGIASLLVPAAVLPDILYIYVPAGGAGGAASGNGSAPVSVTQVCAYPVLSGVYNVILASNNSVGTAGSAGTASAGGFGNSPGSVSASGTNITMASLGIFQAYVPQGGGAGNASAGSATSTLYAAGIPVLGGVGGAGTTGAANAAGGSCTTQTQDAPFLSPLAGGTAGGGRGSDGYALRVPLFFAPGTGGGSNFSGTGGAGGNGATGCGGGGGGGGATGGAGGSGGSGLVIVTAWLQGVASLSCNSSLYNHSP